MNIFKINSGEASFVKNKSAVVRWKASWQVSRQIARLKIYIFFILYSSNGNQIAHKIISMMMAKKLLAGIFMILCVAAAISEIRSL